MMILTECVVDKLESVWSAPPYDISLLTPVRSEDE